MKNDFPACDFMVGETVYVRSVDPHKCILRVHKVVVAKVLPSKKVLARGNVINMVVQDGINFMSIHSNHVFKHQVDAEELE